MPEPLPSGLIFLVDKVACATRISWMEFEGSSDDSVRVDPDVMDIAIWPAARTPEE